MLKTVIIAILAAVTGPVSCTVVTASQRTMNTIVNGNVTIPCTYNTPGPVNDLIIQWTFYSAKSKKPTVPSPCQYMNDKPIGHCQKMVYITDARGRCSWKNKIYVSNEGRAYISADYKDRIEFANRTGNASITIFKMQAWETGVYTCEVLEAVLKANPAPPIEKSTFVNVLAPPSRPLCSFSQNNQQVKLGHFIMLSCLSETGLPNPTYQWSRLEGDTVKPVTEYYDPQTGLLVIGNLTKFEEGYYHCTATNFLGNSTCRLDLTVKHSETGVIIGALIAAILAAALIAAIVWFLAAKEKKKKREEKASEMHAVTQKEPLNAEYVAVPTQEMAPVAAVPPNQESNATNEYATAEEVGGAEQPGNEMRGAGDQEVA